MAQTIDQMLIEVLSTFDNSGFKLAEAQGLSFSSTLKTIGGTALAVFATMTKAGLDFAKSTLELDREAFELDIDPNQLKALGDAMGFFGGKAEDATKALNTFADIAAKAKVGEADFESLLKHSGGKFDVGVFNIEDPLERYKAIADQFRKLSLDQQRLVAQDLNLDPSVMRQMRTGGAGVQQSMDTATDITGGRVNDFQKKSEEVERLLHEINLAWGTIWDGIGRFGIDMLIPILDFGSFASQKIAEFFRVASDVDVNEDRNAIEKVWDAVSARYSEIWEDTKRVTSELWELIKKAVTDGTAGMLASIGQFGNEVYSNIKTFFSDIVDQIETALMNALKAIADFDIAKEATAIFDSTVDSAQKGLEQAGEDIANSLQSFSDSAMNFLGFGEDTKQNVKAAAAQTVNNGNVQNNAYSTTINVQSNAADPESVGREVSKAVDKRLEEHANRTSALATDDLKVASQ